MAAIDDGLQLCTQSVEIDWRGYHKHVSQAHLFIDKQHVVILYTGIGLVLESSVTTHAGIDLIVVNRNYFDMVLLRGTFGECLYQQVRIAALSRAACKNQYVHTVIISSICFRNSQ